MNTEWYVQDNWRVKQNFTIDAGLRFYYLTPTQSEGDEVAAFGPNVWQANQAPLLYTPVSTPQGRQSQNPVNGQIFPLVYLGRLVPGTGRLHQRHGGVRRARRSTKNPFKLAPRIGFAWDVTGDGKTAVRGGAGVFYDRYNDDNILDLVELPPLLNTYTTNYTTIPELLASPLTATPDGGAFHRSVRCRRWSTTGALGVQRDIGWNFVGDFAYVGNAARDQRVDHGRSTAGRTATPTSRRASIRPTSSAASRNRCPTTCSVRIAATAASPSGPTTATATITRCSSRSTGAGRRTA